MKNFLIVVFVACLIIPGCTQSPRTPSVSVDTMADTYAELLVLNERYSLSKDSLSASQYTSEYEEILRNHKFAKEQYVSELELFAQSPTLSKQLFDMTMTKLQEKRTKRVSPGRP